MERRDEKPVEPGKKPYEEPILVERAGLLQIAEGILAGIAGVSEGIPPP